MISTALAGVLAAGRVSYNERMREARRRHPALAQDVFVAFLETQVAAVVDAVAPARLAAVVDACYDAALELVGRALVGPAAKSRVAEAWLRVIPRHAGLLGEEPATVLGMLNNAVLHLESIPGTRPEQWMDEMAALAPSIRTVAQLRAVGQVAAWRAGAAHVRAGAFAACATLPRELALAALHAPSGADLAALARDPWWRGADEYGRDEREIGAFTGFGGQFGAPPEVRALEDGFVVRSAGRCFLVLADAYGAVLRPAGLEEFLAAGAELANATTTAIVSPVSHTIRLVARR